MRASLRAMGTPSAATTITTVALFVGSILPIAALLGAYHLSPLDGLHERFWAFPVSQLLASTLTGIVWGVTYVKRGHETAVLGHPFGDRLTILLFMR